MAEWDLLFTLPNLSPPVPTPFENAGFVICSGRDPRLTQLKANAGNATSLRMLQRFRTGRGTHYRPGCLLIRDDVRQASRSSEAIRAFRNVCAISTTTSTYAIGLDAPYAAQWRVAWSDQFLFGYFVAGHSGSVQTLNGAAMGADNHIPRQQPSAQFSNPTNWSIAADQSLLDRLFRCWRRCYLQKRDRRELLRLFRALEVAFHASLFPADGLTSINDVGTRVALWVSAFEILSHPGGGGSANKRTVQALLRDAPFGMKELTARRYTISYQQQRIRATLPEALYDDLYWARNKFLHGSPVRGSMLRYRQSVDYPPLTTIAPVLFNAALVAHLNRMGVAGAPMDPAMLTLNNVAQYMTTHEGIDRVQKGLAAAAQVNP